MFDINQFKDLIITPALNDLNLYSDNAVELLIFTCAAESQGGKYLHQLKGPALGIYQCEPATHQDLWVNFLFQRHDFMSRLQLNFNVVQIPEPSRLIYDLRYATAICRLHYRRFPDELPHREDIEAIWEYYKNLYNTPKGKAKKDKCIKAYEAFTQSLKSSSSNG